MQTLGRRLGRALAAGDVVGLIGPLGAGKTTLTQGIAVGLEVGADRHVASPTFALVNEHPARVPLVHADLYRVNDAAELAELGLVEAFEAGATVIEWLDRFPDAAPTDRLELRIAFAENDAGGGASGDGGGGDGRTVAVHAGGPRARRLAAALLTRDDGDDDDRHNGGDDGRGNDGGGESRSESGAESHGGGAGG